MVVSPVMVPELVKVERIVLALVTSMAIKLLIAPEAEIVPALVMVNVFPLSKSTAHVPDPRSIVVPAGLSTL